VYVVIGAFLEEWRLVVEFGDEYRRYLGEGTDAVATMWGK
jgi:protein-S-isoprenylcysteine O-methyltransferase Ste14